MSSEHSESGNGVQALTEDFCSGSGPLHDAGFLQAKAPLHSPMTSSPAPLRCIWPTGCWPTPEDTVNFVAQVLATDIAS